LVAVCQRWSLRSGVFAVLPGAVGNLPGLPCPVPRSCAGGHVAGRARRRGDAAPGARRRTGAATGRARRRAGTGDRADASPGRRPETGQTRRRAGVRRRTATAPERRCAPGPLGFCRSAAARSPWG